jgi:hypothetical protein
LIRKFKRKVNERKWRDGREGVVIERKSIGADETQEEGEEEVDERKSQLMRNKRKWKSKARRKKDTV